jgi:DNA-binding response OmpR family regulator
MLTARASVESRIQGLDLGADDYLVKPFHFSEFLARVRAVLRRGGEVRKVNLRVGDLVLDPNSLGASIGGQRVVLTAREFSLLEYLVRNAGRVVSQEEILEHVWNEDVNLFTHTVKVHINNLRKKLKSSGVEGLIRTVKGEGYIVGG